MAQTLTSTLRVGYSATQTNAVDLGTTNFPLRYHYTKAFLDGTTTGKANRLFSDIRTLVGADDEDLDLAGVLTDAFGAALTFVKVKMILIEAGADNPDTITFGPAAATPFRGPFLADDNALIIPAGGLVLLTAPPAGWSVGAGATDLVNVLNNHATLDATYNIMILGTSA